MTMAKGELFFVEKIVRPLYLEMDRFLEGHIEKQIEFINENIVNWNDVIEEEKSKVELAKVEQNYDLRDSQASLANKKNINELEKNEQIVK